MLYQYKNIRFRSMSVIKAEQNTGNIAEKIVQSIKGHRYKGKLNRKHMQRYLFTFANEIGCDFPNEVVIQNVTALMLQDNNLEQISKERMVILVIICLKIQQEHRRVPIGGIFQRVAIGLKQSLHSLQIQAVNHQP